MHGIIFLELKAYVTTNLGPDAWSKLLKASDVQTSVYLPTRAYPDKEALMLLSTASKITHKEIPYLLEDFGSFIVPDLMNLATLVVNPDWKTLDLIEHTEEIIHQMVRLRNPDAQPPELVCQRLSETEILIIYSSGRQMCDLAKGIVRGLSNHFREHVTINETSCLHKGDPQCEIMVRLDD